MKMKKFVCFGLALLLALAAVGCKPNEQGSGEMGGDVNTGLVIALSGNPPTLDPHDSTNTNTGNVVCNIYDALLWRDAEGEFKPMLAKEWTQIDDLTWEFKLRDDVVFHNGEKFNAETVKYNFERAKNPDNAFKYMGRLTRISDVEIVDDYTVRLHTSEVDAVLLARLVTFYMVPQAYAEEVGKDKMAVEPVGTGPFKFENWIPDDRVELVVNEDYWGPKSDFTTLTFRPLPEQATRVAALKTGEVDVVEKIDPDNYNELSESPNVQVHVIDSANTLMIDFNQHTELGANEDFRLAIAHAVNPQEIISDLLSGFAEPLDRPMSNRVPMQPEELKRKPYDVNKAKEYLAAAGYPDGLTMDLDVSSGLSIMDKEIAIVVAEQLKEVGINANVIANEAGVFYDKLDNHTVTPMFIDGAANSWLDPDIFVNGFYNGGATSFCDIEELNEMIRLGASSADPAVRAVHYKDMYYFMVEHAIAIPILQYKGICATSDRVNWVARADARVDVREMTLVK